MHAASRDAYAAIKVRLDAYASAGEAAQAATSLVELANVILAVSALLAREPRLRRALADNSRPAQDRTGLLRTLLAGKLDGKLAAGTPEVEVLTLLDSLVEARWSGPNELLGVTERLGVEALLASAERAGELGEVEDELFRFGHVVAGDRPLAAALSDSTVEYDRRAALVRDLLDGKARGVTVRLAERAVAGFGGHGLAGALERLVELTAERRDRTVAYVTSAVLPTEDEERRLTELLSGMYGRQISLKVDVKPEIVGGMSVRVGSDLYDGTVQRRLTEARHALSK